MFLAIIGFIAGLFCGACIYFMCEFICDKLSEAKERNIRDEKHNEIFSNIIFNSEA